MEGEKKQANEDFNMTNKSLEILRKLKSQQRIHLEKEPKLSDYYKPSPEMQKYKHWASMGIGLIGGFLGTKALEAII